MQCDFCYSRLFLLSFTNIFIHNSDLMSPLCKTMHVFDLSDALQLGDYVATPEVCTQGSASPSHLDDGLCSTIHSCISCEFGNAASTATSFDTPCVFCNARNSIQCGHSLTAVCINGTLKLTCSSDVIAQGVVPAYSPPRTCHVPFNILTQNCMHTADDDNEFMVSNERALFLEAIGDQFSIIGLQAARSTPGKKFVPGYVLFAVGHLNHSRGVETWISIDQAFRLV